MAKTSVALYGSQKREGNTTFRGHASNWVRLVLPAEPFMDILGRDKA